MVVGNQQSTECRYYLSNLERMLKFPPLRCKLIGGGELAALNVGFAKKPTEVSQTSTVTADWIMELFMPILPQARYRLQFDLLGERDG